MLPEMSADAIVMGNIDPLLFTSATPEQIKESVKKLFDECKEYPNFMISSGCDIPSSAEWKNIDAYFEITEELYS